MGILDLTLPTIEANLALDEVLLQGTVASDPSRASGLLRFWEFPRHAVVLGINGRLEDEVHRSTCAALDISLARRGSGGGTVLIGPGCLCFSLILPLTHHPSLINVSLSYEWIMNHMAAALRSLTPSMAEETIQWRGSSDLAMGNFKVSGNAQKRSRQALLHHGTLLYDFDLTLLPKCLKEPERRPEYRGSREHVAFVRNLPIAADQLKHALAQAWLATDPYAPPPQEQVEEMVRQRHGRSDWLHRR